MTALQSIARRKMLDGPGQLYAAYSRYCDWIKVGFSSKLPNRLEAINHQYAEFAPFSLMGSLPSTWRAEQQLHRLLTPFRQRHIALTRELYPAAPSVVRALKVILSNDQWLPLGPEGRREVFDWARRMAELPPNRDEAIGTLQRFYAERRAA